MDRLALAAANALVGNAPDAAAIEFTLLGGAFSVDGGSARLAVAGASASLMLDSSRLAPWRSFVLRPGQVLTVGPMTEGVFAYLAVSGGFDLPPQLGSLSLHKRAALGGFHGRTFRAGDRVPLRWEEPSGRDLEIAPLPLDRAAPVRVVWGPQDDHFTPEGLATFLSSSYVVSQEADRMGYRLSGPKIAHAHGFNIISDGIVAGSVQVPGSGMPIVTLADRQTTGGYPKIASVASADLRVIAHRRPGDAVRFEAISCRGGTTPRPGAGAGDRRAAEPGAARRRDAAAGAAPRAQPCGRCG